MSRTKIDYGIDLGTTNSAISRVDGAEIKIIKSLDTQADTTPSCVAYRNNGSSLIGDGAARNYRSGLIDFFKKDKPLNAFVEFKRTMGSDKKYTASNLNKSLSSEELSAEVLKQLKAYVQDEQVKAAVITVPAAFKSNQIDATLTAANLAGFEYVEVLQEPVAAAMAYGIDSQDKNGFWLVFDFGGGTFDAALLKAEEGIMRVVDTEGDNYLGGKNLDYAIVDSLIIPHIQESFEIDELLSVDSTKSILRETLKFFADELKINLSFNPSYNIYIEPGDFFEDDEGEEIEIDLTVTQEELKPILKPLFQKSIDLALELLKRNNLKGTEIDSLILVGGPTHSPILREMLEKQICKPDTSVDPMTVVSRGAALYASTVALSDEIVEQSRDNTKIQLEINCATSTVDLEVFAAIKILEDKTEGSIPSKVFAEIIRGDNAWHSEKIEIDAIGEIIDVQLSEGKTNVFEVRLFDEKGNVLDAQPSSFKVIQGSVVGAATLPYNVGIEIQEIDSNKIIFTSLSGLEKNKSLPALGVKNGLKTPRDIRPGMACDYLEIPVYQGEYGADGTRAIHNHHVSTILITGSDLPALLPANSDVDITLKIDKSQKLTGKAFFPYLEYEYEFECESKVDSVDTDWLNNEFTKAASSINELKHKGINSTELDQAEKQIIESQTDFLQNKEDIDTKQQALSNLRKSLKVLDKLQGDREWPDLERELKEAFHSLEEINREKGNSQTTEMVGKIKPDVEQAIREKNIKNTPALINDINSLAFELERLEHLIGFLFYMEESFDDFDWRDKNDAKSAINRGKGIISQEPSVASLQPIINDLYDNSRLSERNASDIEAVVANNRLLRG